MPTTTDIPPMLHAKAVADLLNVSERTVLRMAADPKQADKVGAVRVSGVWRFRRAAIARLCGDHD